MLSLISILGIVVAVGISLIAATMPEVFSFITLIPFGDKIGHFLFYGVLTIVIICAHSANYETRIKGICKVIVGFILADEIFQIYLVNRTFSVADILASVAGVLLFAELYRKMKLRKST